MVDSELFFVVYLLLILIPLLGIWIWSERRDLVLRAPLPIKWLYRCMECEHFHESEEQSDKKQCPLCGRQNERLKI
jgi:hypothetical protein